MSLKKFFLLYCSAYYECCSKMDSENRLVSGLLHIINGLQISSFVITMSNKSLESNGSTAILKGILIYTRVVPIFSTSFNVNTVLLLLALILALNMCFIASIISLAGQSKTASRLLGDRYTSKFESLACSYVRFFGETLQFCFLIPSLELGLSGIFIKTSFRDLNDISASQEIATLVISLATILLLIVNSCTIKYFQDSYNFFQLGTTRTRFCKINLWQLFFESALVFFVKARWSISAVAVHVLVQIYQLIRLGDFIRAPYFIDKSYSKLFLMLMTALISHNIMFTIRELSDVFPADEAFVVWLAFIVCGVFTSLFLFERLNSKLLVSKWDNSDDLEDFVAGNEELFYLCEKSYRCFVSYLTVSGYFRKHRKNCKDRGCVYCTKYDMKQFFSEERYFDVQLFVEYLDESFQERIKKAQSGTAFKHFESFMLKYYSFLIKHKRNYFKAVYNLRIQAVLMKDKESFHYSAVALYYNRIIEEGLKLKRKSFAQKDSKQYETALEFNVFVLGEKLKIKLKNEMIAIINLKIKYWKALIEGVESIALLLNMYSSLLRKIELVELEIKGQLNHAPDNITFIKMYSILLGKITGSPLKAFQLDMRSFEIKKRDSYKDPSSIHTVSIMRGLVTTLIVNFLDDFGKILSHSENLPSFFGYSSLEFASVQNLNSFLPDFLKLNHDALVKRLISTGKPVALCKYRLSFGKAKNGFVFPIKLFVNVFLQNLSDFSFSGLLLKVVTDSNFIIINDHFIIEEFEEGFVTRIGLSNSLAQRLLKTHIAVLLPDLVDNMTTLNENLYDNKLSFKGSMFIPDDFSSAINKFSSKRPFEQGGRAVLNYSESPYNMAASLSKDAHRKFDSRGRRFNVGYTVIRDSCQPLGRDLLSFYVIEFTEIQEIRHPGSVKSIVAEHVSSEKREAAPSKETNIVITQPSVEKNVQEDDSSKRPGYLLETDSYRPQLLIKEKIYELKISQEKKAFDAEQPRPLYEAKQIIRDPRFLSPYPEENEGLPFSRFSEILMETPPQLLGLDQSAFLEESFSERSAQADDLNDGKAIELKSLTRLTEIDEEKKTILQSLSARKRANTKFNQLIIKDRKALTLLEEQEEVASNDYDDENMNSSRDYRSFTKAKPRSNFRSNRADVPGGRESSVGSSAITPLTSTLLLIQTIINSKKTPFLIKSLYFSMFFKIATFSILVLLYGIILAGYFENYKQVQDRLSAGTDIQLPLWRSMNIVVRNAMTDLNILKPISTQSNFTIILTNQRDDYQKAYVKFLRMITTEDSETFYFDIKGELSFEYNKVERADAVSFLGFLLATSNNLKTIQRELYPRKLLSFSAKEVRTIVENFEFIQKCFQDVNLKVLTNLNEEQSKLELINKLCLSFALGLLLISAVLTVPAYSKYNRYLERIIIKLVTKVEEREARSEIVSLEECRLLLLRKDEKFLNLDYSGADTTDSNTLKGGLSTQDPGNQYQSAGMKKRLQTLHLSDRIKNPSLPRLRFLSILTLLYIAGSAFFLFAFHIISNFHPYIDASVSTYTQYVEQSTKFSNYFLVQNLVLFDPLMRSNKTNPQGAFYYKSDFIQRLNQTRSQALSEAYEFFSDEYLSTIINRNNELINNFNSPDLCKYAAARFIYYEGCRKMADGILDRGLQSLIMTLLQFHRNEEVFLGDTPLEQYLQHLNSKEYSDIQDLIQIFCRAASFISKYLKEQNRDMITDYQNMLVTMFVIGSLAFFILFVVSLKLFFKKLLHNFRCVNHSLQFIPPNKLSADETLRILIKKFVLY